MNEEQALAQQKFSSGQNNDEDEKTISRSTYKKMLVAAIVLDVLTALINLIPFVGGIISTVFIWAPGFLVFFFIYRKLGVKFHLKNTSKFGISALIEAIPVINALPGFTLSVILNLRPMIKDDEDEDQDNTNDEYGNGDNQDLSNTEIRAGNPEQNQIQQFFKNNRS